MQILKILPLMQISFNLPKNFYMIPILQVFLRWCYKLSGMMAKGHMYQFEIRNHGPEMTESKVISKNSCVQMEL